MRVGPGPRRHWSGLWVLRMVGSQQGSDMSALHLKVMVLNAGREQTEGTRSRRQTPDRRLLLQPRPEVGAWTNMKGSYRTQEKVDLTGSADGCLWVWRERHQEGVHILEGAGWWGQEESWQKPRAPFWMF